MHRSRRILGIIAAFAMLSSTIAPVYADQLDSDAADSIAYDSIEEDEEDDEENDSEDEAKEDEDIPLGWSVHLDEDGDALEEDDMLRDVSYSYTPKRYSYDSSTKTIELRGELPDSGYDPKTGIALVFPDQLTAEHVKFLASATTSQSAEAMFYDLQKVTDYTNLTYLDTSNAVTMRDMFHWNESVRSLNLSKFKTANVTNMSGMFTSCHSLTALDLSSFNTKKVTNMSYMFTGCASLESVNMSNFTVSSSTDVRYMFNGCSSLTSLTIPAGFTVSTDMCVPNADDVYAGWAKAGTNLIISGSGAYASFTAAEAGEYVRVKKEDIWCSWNKSTGTLTVFGQLPSTSYGNYRYNNIAVLAGVDPLAVRKVVIESGTYAGNSCNYMFIDMENLTTITGLGSLNVGYNTEAEYMLTDCKRLRSADLSAFLPSKVRNVDGMFEGCTSLTELKLPKGFMVNYTNLPNRNDTYAGWAEEDAPNTISGTGTQAYFTPSEAMTYHRITYDQANSWFTWDSSSHTLYLSGRLPDTNYDTKNKKPLNIAYYAGVDPDDVYTVQIERGTKAGKYTGYMFTDMSSLSNIEGLEYLDTSKVTSMRSMFAGCKCLRRLDLTSLDMKNVVYYDHMFEECENLLELKLKAGFQVKSEMALPNFIGDLKGWSTGGSTDGKCISGSGVYAVFTAPFTSEYVHTSGYFSFNDKTGELTLRGQLPGTVYNSFTKTYHGLAYFTNISSEKVKKITVTKGTRAGTSTAGMFMDMTNLTEINGLDGLDTSITSDAAMMFYNCRSLTSLDMTAFNNKKCEMTGMFLNTDSLTELSLPAGFTVGTHMLLANAKDDYLGWAVKGTTNIISGKSENAAFSVKNKCAVVRLRDEKPVSPAITKIEPGNGKMTVYWEPVVNASKYTVYFFRKGEAEKSVDCAASKTSAYIDSLENGIYNVYVKAVVDGKRTTEKKMTTAELADYGIKCTTQQNGSGKITISWAKNPNWGKVTGNQMFKVVCIDENNNIKATRTTSRNSFNWTGLHNNTTYGFYVQPMINGVYPTFKPEDAADKAYIAWTCPVNSPMITKLSLGNHKVWLYYETVPRATKYYIYVIQDDVEYLKGTTTASKYLVTGLDNDIPATFYVKALVDGKLTPVKRNATRTTRDGIKPALDITAGQCVISWSKYTDSNGAATQYKVVFVDANYKQIDTRETKNTKFTWKDTRLVKGTKYGFYVVPYVNGEYIPFGLSHADDKANVVMFTAG